MNQIKKIIDEIKCGFDMFSETIGLIFNSIILLFAYIIGIGIASILAKIKGKQFLDTKISNMSISYWNDLKIKKSINDYHRQF
jgi:hypothetical protein